MSHEIRIVRSDSGGLCTLTLNRPDKLNALDTQAFEELDAHLAALEGQADTTGCVVLNAAGKGFCAGGDIDAWSRMSAADFQIRWVRHGHRVFDRLARLRQPTIAVLAAQGTVVFLHQFCGFRRDGAE